MDEALRLMRLEGNETSVIEEVLLDYLAFSLAQVKPKTSTPFAPINKLLMSFFFYNKKTGNKPAALEMSKRLLDLSKLRISQVKCT